MPRRSLLTPVAERIVRQAIPGARVLANEPLVDGLRNSNFKLRLDRPPGAVVLRFYEHDASLCQKELDLIRLLRGALPVADVLHAESRGCEELPPFVILRWLAGHTFRELKRAGDREATAQAAHAIGQTLAAIGRFTFPKSGWIIPGPAVGAPLLEGTDAMPRFVDLCLATPNLRRRVPADLRDGTRAAIWQWAPRLAGLECETRLVHGDFNKRNTLVRCDEGRWTVAAVLDWEFAVSGTPLADVGNFLRYERTARPIAEPHFSAGYRAAGGELPEDWRRLARIVDLVALSESLSREQLPDQVTAELVELVRATIEDRDPQFQ